MGSASPYGMVLDGVLAVKDGLISWVGPRSEWRGELTQFMRENDEQKRIATEWQFYNENSLKAWKGRQAALGDDAMMRKQADAEATLRKQVPDAFDAIEKAHAKFKPLFRRYYILEKWSKGDLLNDAIRLVRAADERAVANGQRLDEYRDSALPDIEQKVMSTAAIYPAREKLALAFWLGKVREELDEVEGAVAEQHGKQRVAEEIGDLLFAAVNLARQLDVDPEAALRDANAKFTRRFHYVERRAREEKIPLAEAGLERLDGYWNEIRAADKAAG